MVEATLMPISDFYEHKNKKTGAIEAAVLETVSELESNGQLVGKYKAVAIALQATARAVDDGLAAGGRVSVATAQLTQRLFETLDKLPEPQVDTGSAFDTLQATVTALTGKALSA